MKTMPSSPTPKESTERLQRRIARAGVCSRRAAENLIADGRVRVNGTIVSEQGRRVASTDRISVDGREIDTAAEPVYLLLHKPTHVVSTSHDPEGRRTAVELVSRAWPSMHGSRDRSAKPRLFSVGRLDYLSSGAMLFTNDGDFAHLISHPSSQVEKEYVVSSPEPIPDRVVEAFTAGITIDEVHYRARHVERSGDRRLRLILIEGKNREIRRVFAALGVPLAGILRTRIGPVAIGDLPEGSVRLLSTAERQSLRRTAERGRGGRETSGPPAASRSSSQHPTSNGRAPSRRKDPPRGRYH